MSDVTEILNAIDQGQARADELLPLVYEELRKLAAARMAQESPGQTLQPTALVHEAWLRLTGNQDQKWDGRGHFFAAAAEAMRRILVEQARRKDRVRHGGDRQRIELADAALARVPDAETILAVDEAVARLAEQEPQTAEVVKLHFFAGLTLDETAAALQISRASVYRHWAFARASLRLLLREGRGE
jgi:RNA polymerase sigma factor (TIGR02999 family)